MPKFSIAEIEETGGTGYPPEFAGDVDGRLVRRLTAPDGLTQFGVNLVR